MVYDRVTHKGCNFNDSFYPVVDITLNSAINVVVTYNLTNNL